MLNTEKIKKYLNLSHSRNNIVICKNENPNIEFLDLGKEISLNISSFLSETKVGLKSILMVEELLHSSIIEDTILGKCLAIKNLGILFESELKIDFVQMLNKYSSSNTLFVKWDGEIEDGILYFLTKEKGQKIDIKNLSHIVI